LTGKRRPEVDRLGRYLGESVFVFDFTEGTHPISRKGTTEIGGAKRRSDFELFTLTLHRFSNRIFSL
jgi:hypothetical protein